MSVVHHDREHGGIRAVLSFMPDTYEDTFCLAKQNRNSTFVGCATTTSKVEALKLKDESCMHGRSQGILRVYNAHIWCESEALVRFEKDWRESKGL